MIQNHLIIKYRSVAHIRTNIQRIRFVHQIVMKI